MVRALIVAVDRNGLIGVANALPWSVPDELRRFRALTSGKPVIMGRRTYESIGAPLSGRRNVVLSSQPMAVPGVVVARSLEAAWEAAAAGGALECMVIGGASVYQQAMPAVDRIYLSTIKHGFDVVAGAAAAYLPAMVRPFREVARWDHDQGPGSPFPWSLCVLDAAD